ncbi:MAG: flagellar hook-associated protein FlgK [Planctomycetes bacterium]|nr:flagellar hook-associated protein FlgK [Planctomycetota bacterium]
MSYGFGFGTALRGLNAARLSMEIIGQNVANANTPGYTRQRVLLGSTLPTKDGARGFFIGTGVQVETVNRILDERLDARLRTQMGLTGAAEIDYRRMSEIEGILGEPGEGGLSGLFNDYFDSISKLRTDAGQRALRGGVVQAGQELAGGFNLLARRFASLEDDSKLEIEGYVREVNTLAEQIADLNREIVSLEVGQHPANDLRDRRENAIRGLSELLDTQAIEKANGSVDILAGGYILVSGGRASTLRSQTEDAGTVTLRIGQSTARISPKQGKLAALLNADSSGLGDVIGNIDRLAFGFALEVNRIHTTGMAKKGPFQVLLADNSIGDGNGNGNYGDEILAYGDLPFPVTNGELYVAVTNRDTGDIERHRITIDPNSMTLGELSQELDAIPRLSSSVDPTGRLRIQAEQGFGFDFSRRLDSAPNSAGSMGGASASLGTKNQGPYAFPNLPASFDIRVDGGTPSTITLSSTDFFSPSDVSAEELATVLDEKFQSASIAADAVAVGNGISIKTGSRGTTSSLQITDGANSPAALLGLPLGVTANGRANSLSVAISGNYDGSSNGHYRFVAEGSGQIGVTPGLQIGVFDQDGRKLGSLDVGQGYAPNDRLTIGDGVEVAIGPGEISAVNGDQFALDVLADPDSADILVALGLNTFFTGSTADTIAVSERLADDPDQVAAGLSLVGSTSSQGDAGNLIRLEELRQFSIEAFSGNTIEGFWNATASEVGYSTRKSKGLLESQSGLQEFLQNQRDSVSGVDLDEEAIELERFQQAYQASARYLNIMTEVSDILLSLGA